MDQTCFSFAAAGLLEYLIQPAADLCFVRTVDLYALFPFHIAADIFVERGVASSYAAAAGGAEGNDLFAAEIIAFQESLYDPGSNAPPDRKSHNDSIVRCHIYGTSCDFRSCGRVIHFHTAAALLVHPIKIGGGIDLFRDDLIEIRAGDPGDLLSDFSRNTAGGEYRH